MEKDLKRLIIIDTGGDNAFWAGRALVAIKALLSVLVPLRDAGLLFTPDYQRSPILTFTVLNKWFDLTALRDLYFIIKTSNEKGILTTPNPVNGLDQEDLTSFDTIQFDRIQSYLTSVSVDIRDAKAKIAEGSSKQHEKLFKLLKAQNAVFKLPKKFKKNTILNNIYEQQKNLIKCIYCDSKYVEKIRVSNDLYYCNNCQKSFSNSLVIDCSLKFESEKDIRNFLKELNKKLLNKNLTLKIQTDETNNSFTILSVFNYDNYVKYCKYVFNHLKKENNLLHRYNQEIRNLKKFNAFIIKEEQNQKKKRFYSSLSLSDLDNIYFVDRMYSTIFYGGFKVLGTYKHPKYSTASKYTVESTKFRIENDSIVFNVRIKQHNNGCNVLLNKVIYSNGKLHISSELNDRGYQIEWIGFNESFIRKAETIIYYRGRLRKKIKESYI